MPTYPVKKSYQIQSHQTGYIYTRAIKTTQNALFHLNNVTIRQPVNDKKSTSYCYEWQNSLF